MSETLRPEAILEARHPEMWPPDHARAVENAYAAVDAFAANIGLVEVEVVVGEEPEEGVEFEAVTSLREHIGGSVARTWDHMPLQRQILFASKFVATDPGEIVALPLR